MMQTREREAETAMGGEKMKRRHRQKKEAAQKPEEEDKRILKALQPCQQGEEQANNAV